MDDLFREEVLQAQRSCGLGTVGIAISLERTWRASLAAAGEAATALIPIFGNYTQSETIEATQPLVEVSAELISHAVVSSQLRAREVNVRTTLTELKPEARAQATDLRIRVNLLHAKVRQIGGQLTMQQAPCHDAPTSGSGRAIAPVRHRFFSQYKSSDM